MRLIQHITAIALSLTFVTSFATPAALLTDNQTSEDSNAYIDGTPSPYPTKAHSKRSVEWNLVKFACWGHIVNDQCTAVIKMATNTSSPITLGQVTMNMTSGMISPSHLSNNGYTMTVKDQKPTDDKIFVTITKSH